MTTGPVRLLHEIGLDQRLTRSVTIDGPVAERLDQFRARAFDDRNLHLRVTRKNRATAVGTTLARERGIAATTIRRVSYPFKASRSASPASIQRARRSERASAAPASVMTRILPRSTSFRRNDRDKSLTAR